MPGPIYVVDDEALIRAAVVAILEEAGYRAEAFENAEQLYTRIVDGPDNPSLILVDEMLPDESGDTIVRSLRERPQYRDIPFIFLTAVDRDSAERLTDMAPVIRKPFDFGELVRRIEEQIGPPTRGEEGVALDATDSGDSGEDGAAQPD